MDGRDVAGGLFWAGTATGLRRISELDSFFLRIPAFQALSFVMLANPIDINRPMSCIQTQRDKIMVLGLKQLTSKLRGRRLNDAMLKLSIGE